jgi:hypothetical protein
MIARARKYDKGTDAVPTIEGLALHLGVARSSCYLWAEVPSEPDEGADLAEWQRRRQLHQHFSDIVNDLLAQQAKLLINNGLKGKFNANITKLILSGKHGYVEKVSNEHTGPEGGPIKTEAVQVMDLDGNQPKTEPDS